MERPDNPHTLLAVGGVRAVVKMAALEEAQYWLEVLTKYKTLPRVTPDEHIIIDAQLPECRKIIAALEKELSVPPDVRAKREKTRLRVQKHRNKKPAPIEQPPQTKITSLHNRQWVDGDDDDPEFDKYLDEVSANHLLD